MLISDRLAELKKEYDKFTMLAKKFPDIEIYKDRWKNEYYCSKSVNAIADQILFKNSCGCCRDCSKQAHPYTVVNGITVTTYPQTVTVAFHGSWDEILYQNPTWRESARGFNQKIIDEIERYVSSLPVKKIDAEAELDE